MFLLRLLLIFGIFYAETPLRAADVPNLTLDADNPGAIDNVLSKAARWGGVTWGIALPYDAQGATAASDIQRINDLKWVARETLSRGQRLTVRLNGHPFMGISTPSPWKVLAGSDPTESKYYPPAGPDQAVWKRIGYWHGQYALILKDICDSLGVPTSRVTLELSNEVGIGGITGPYRYSWTESKAGITNAYTLYSNYLAGSSSYDAFKSEWLKWMPEWTLQDDGSPLPMGSIPKRYFQQMIVQRQQYDPIAMGFQVVGGTLEMSGTVNPDGTYSGDLKFELDSWRIPEAQEYRMYFNRSHFNFYGPSARNQSVYENGAWIRRDLTPTEAAQQYKLKLERRRALIASHPVLGGLPIGITESNVNISAIPGATLVEQLTKVADYRQAVLDVIPSVPSISEIGWFLAIERASGTDGNGIYNYDSTLDSLTPVGTFEIFPPRVDVTAPLVSITSPTQGQTISGTSTVQISATDEVGVSSVTLLIDGVPQSTPDTTSPYAFSVDTKLMSNGSHSFQARAQDASGNEGSSTVVGVTVQNTVPDTTPPTVSITSPANGAVVGIKSNVTIQATAQDNVLVSRVEFYVNGSLTCTDTSAPYSCTFRTGGKRNATYSLNAKAVDTSGNSATSTLKITAR